MLGSTTELTMCSRLPQSSGSSFPKHIGSGVSHRTEGTSKLEFLIFSSLCQTLVAVLFQVSTGRNNGDIWEVNATPDIQTAAIT